MDRKNIQLCWFVSAIVLSFSVVESTCGQPPSPTSDKNIPRKVVVKPDVNRGKVLGDPRNAENDLKRIYQIVTTYRKRHEGAYPSSILEVFKDLGRNLDAYGFPNEEAVWDALTNPDNKYHDRTAVRKNPQGHINYLIFNKRPDGSSIDMPKAPGTQDVLAFSDTYLHHNLTVSDKDQPVDNTIGFIVLLRDDGSVDKCPYDELFYVPSQQGFKYAFPNQPGVPYNIINFEEYSLEVGRMAVPPLGKPLPEDLDTLTADNGGPESLIAFSRLFSFPSRYGIEREELWRTFNVTQEEFSLQDVQQGASKLKLSLEQKELTLNQISQLNTPAIFLTNDDKRIVVLANISLKEAIVVDRGMTRIVSRELLAKRYGGKALLSTKALEAPPQVRVDDPVRVINLQAQEEEVSQTVTFTNTGNVPVALQIERPIPGVTRAELSSDTVAAGATATLSLTLKWRSVLQGETQNVFVFVRTTDPARPRLQLGFQLKRSGSVQAGKLP